MRVGPYKLDELIGRGAFSEVHRGQAPDGRPVILKLASEPRHAWMLGQEALFRRRLDNHPGILPLLDLRLDDTPPAVVFPDLGGATLRELLSREGPFSPARAGRILCRLLEVLQAIHRRGGIHRDIKPENVLLLPGDELRLIDFGLGEFAGRLPRRSWLEHSLRTAWDPATAGTLGYLPPEERQGLPPSSASDVYAAGVLLFEMLTGRMPDRLQRPGLFLPSPPDGLDEFFLHACCRRAQRFASTTAALRAARRLAAACSAGFCARHALVLQARHPLSYGPIRALTLSREALLLDCPASTDGPLRVAVCRRTAHFLLAGRLPRSDDTPTPALCPEAEGRWAYRGDRFGRLQVISCDGRPIRLLHQEEDAITALLPDGPLLHAATAGGVLLTFGPGEPARAPRPRRPAPDLPREAWFGRFRLLSLAGRGAVASVWKARDPASRVVALKLPLDPEFAPLLLEGARAQSRLRHPRVAAVLEVVDDPPHAVLEWGGPLTLRGLIRGPERRSRALPVLRDLLRALRELAAAGIVHGDLKPENVLLAGDSILLTDLGQRAAPRDRPGLVELSLKSGAGPLLAGSAAYLSPDRRAGRPACLADDCYALATICFELFASELPDVLDRPSDFSDRLPAGVAPAALDRLYAGLCGTACPPERLDRAARQIDELLGARPRRVGGLLRRLAARLTTCARGIKMSP